MEREQIDVAVENGTAMPIPMIRKEWLTRYNQVLRPGKYKLRSARNVTTKDVVTDVSGNRYYDMVFRAITLDKFDELRTLFRDRDEVARSQFINVLLQSRASVSDKGYSILPLKGEELSVIVDYVTDESGRKELKVIAFRVEEPEVPEVVDLSSMFGPAADEKAEIIREALKENNELTLQH